MRDTYREYLEWARSFWALAETCSTKESPDRERVLLDVFKLQMLYTERESLRFEYLLANDPPEIVDLRSLTSINERLLKGWREIDDAGLKDSNPAYASVLRGIKELEGKTNSPALDEPFRALRQNASYRDARLAFARKVQQLDEKLRS